MSDKTRVIPAARASCAPLTRRLDARDVRCRLSDRRAAAPRSLGDDLLADVAGGMFEGGR
jgi:hypothetical protein